MPTQAPDTTTNESEIMPGLTAFTPSTAGENTRGPLPLPKTFDQRRYVGKWAKAGADLQAARQQEIIAAAKVKVAGWEVWKDEKGKMCKRTLSAGTFILLCRPRGLQETVNKIHGNLSRLRMIQEAKGETLNGEHVQDRGILTNLVLSNVPGLKADEAEGVDVPLHNLSETSGTGVQIPVAARASASAKTKSTKKAK